MVITSGNDGYVLMGHGCYNLHTGAPMRSAALLRRFHGTGDGTSSSSTTTSVPTASVTVRITTAALREVRVGDLSVY